jgi:hypothetical protein
VLDTQERSISLWDTAVAERPVGMEGGVISTVTVVWDVVVPLRFAAVKVYTVVEAGETETEPVDVAD